MREEKLKGEYAMQNEKRELTYLDYCGLWHKEREFALETIC
jgi:hypothetical protein